MKINHYKLFPTLVLEFSNFLSIQECKKILKIIKKNKHWLKKHNSVTKGKSSHSLQCFLSETKQTSLKNKILEAAKLYAQTGGYEIREKMDNSWFNIEEKESHLIKHSHPLSILSGALYLNIDEKSSSLYFFNPNSYALQNTMSKESSEYGYEWVKFTPNLGTLYIFPSWLVHVTDTNKMKERIVLSCNII